MMAGIACEVLGGPSKDKRGGHSPISDYSPTETADECAGDVQLLPGRSTKSM
jgi:hypothetical protein